MSAEQATGKVPTQAEMDRAHWGEVRAKFNPEFVPLVAITMARHDIRYYLNGIRIERAVNRPGVYIITTDGHRMSIAYDAYGVLEGPHDGLIMTAPPAFIAACRSAGRAKPAIQMRKVIIEGMRVSIGTDFGCQHIAAETYVMPGRPYIEGNYPNWRKIAPRWSELSLGLKNSLNPFYLADLAKLCGAKNSRLSGFHLWQAGPDRIVAVQFDRHPELVQLIMPLLNSIGSHKFEEILPEAVNSDAASAGSAS